MATRFTFRVDTSSNWQAANPILAMGEPSWESDTLSARVGDGATPYVSLPVAFSILLSQAGIINDDAVNVSSSQVWSNQFTQSQLNNFLQQANAYSDKSSQAAQLVVLDQASDGTWSARPTTAVVFARGYPGRTDPPYWLTTADQYQMRS